MPRLLRLRPKYNQLLLEMPVRLTDRRTLSRIRAGVPFAVAFDLGQEQRSLLFSMRFCVFAGQLVAERWRDKADQYAPIAILRGPGNTRVGVEEASAAILVRGRNVRSRGQKVSSNLTTLPVSSLGGEPRSLRLW